MVLAGFKHSESESLQSGSHSLRRRITLNVLKISIHARALDDITVENIATHAEVSLRTLFYGFKRWRGTTPMAVYVRDAKLDIARRELEQGRQERRLVAPQSTRDSLTSASSRGSIKRALEGIGSIKNIAQALI